MLPFDPTLGPSNSRAASPTQLFVYCRSRYHTSMPGALYAILPTFHSFVASLSKFVSYAYFRPRSKPEKLRHSAR